MAMELDHAFTVPVPPDQAWDVLLDVKRIAPCMPGATVDEVDGDLVTGHIKVKVGPVSLTYRGAANFSERDPDARTIVVTASGKETRGAGTASATVQASLEPSGDDATKVTMHTTMNVTGRPAQFGRGVMVEVGGKLVEQFAQNLAQQLGRDLETDTGGAGQSGGQADTGNGAAGSSPTDSAGSGTATGNGAADGSAAGSGTATGNGAHGTGTAQASGTTASSAAAPAPPAADHINMIRLVAPALLKRVVPIAALAAGIALLSRRFWRRMHKGAGA
jgi:carbon monoxide dehydrogenase subunit G